jgi:hypothetical protein
MAGLQVTLDEEQTEIGASASEAYVKLAIYTHDLKSGAIAFSIEYHYNKQAFNNGRRPIKGASYTVTEAELSGNGGIRAQLYEWLKTRPEFAGAIDVV